MARVCPICPKTSLETVPASDVEIDSCPGCGGLWFDQGELELFPERPSAEVFLRRAAHAPSRCRRNHLIARANAACATCGSDPLRCPGCRGRLSLVRTASCAVDVCPSCEGIWLDSGELERLEGYVEAPAAPAPAQGGGKWEIPEAAPAFDPYRAPGQQRATEAYARAAESIEQHPFGCTRCGAALNATSAFAFDGDLFCADCRPSGAIAGTSLPSDFSITAFDRVLDLLTRRRGRRLF